MINTNAHRRLRRADQRPTSLPVDDEAVTQRHPAQELRDRAGKVVLRGTAVRGSRGGLNKRLRLMLPALKLLVAHGRDAERGSWRAPWWPSTPVKPNVDALHHDQSQSGLDIPRVNTIPGGRCPTKFGAWRSCNPHCVGGWAAAAVASPNAWLLLFPAIGGP